ncbi:hypothetical protein BDZ91DRAFT_256741 [Kalaharituber pfeilii]|nr:hypothetical protein BDZ91DRAFT_256741 [Kalaharituber pfeilii]
MLVLYVLNLHFSILPLQAQAAPTSTGMQDMQLQTISQCTNGYLDIPSAYHNATGSQCNFSRRCRKTPLPIPHRRLHQFLPSHSPPTPPSLSPWLPIPGHLVPDIPRSSTLVPVHSPFSVSYSFPSAALLHRLISLLPF